MKEYKIETVLQEFKEKYGGYTWVVFDTETLGFCPYRHQMTEIAAAVVESPFEEWNIVSEFRKKARFTDKTRIRLGTPYTGKGKSYADLLSMTQYGESCGSWDYVEEEEMINDFIKYLSQIDNPLLIAHNAPFDMRFLSVRNGIYGKILKDYKVLDSLAFLKRTFKPSLKTKNGFRLDEIRLGRVAEALGVPSLNWHTADADVMMLLNIVKELDILYQDNLDVNIRPEVNKDLWKIKQRKRKKKRKRK